jgi:hypothetical protein
MVGHYFGIEQDPFACKGRLPMLRKVHAANRLDLAG